MQRQWIRYWHKYFEALGEWHNQRHKLFYRNNGVVRAVRLQTGKNFLERPIQLLYRTD